MHDDAIKLDSNGKPADFTFGDRVLLIPHNIQATVVSQTLHYDSGETFWGNLNIIDDEHNAITCHCWQVHRIEQPND